MIGSKLVFPQLRKDEWEVLKEIVKYCKKGDVEVQLKRYVIERPAKILIELTKDDAKKLTCATALHFMKRLESELEMIKGIKYIPSGRNRQIISYFCIPVNIKEQVEDLIEQGKIQIVDRRPKKKRQRTFDWK